MGDPPDSSARTHTDNVPPRLPPTKAHALPGPPSGVYYIPDFLSPEIETGVLNTAAAVPDKHSQWVHVRGRRLQCYGGALDGCCVCIYTATKNNNPIPSFLALLPSETHIRLYHPFHRTHVHVYTKGEPTEPFQPEQLPAWVAQLCEALVGSGVFTREGKPNHVLLNGEHGVC